MDESYTIANVEMQIDVEKNTITIPLDKKTMKKFKKYPLGKIDVVLNWHWDDRKKALEDSRSNEIKSVEGEK